MLRCLFQFLYRLSGRERFHAGVIQRTVQYLRTCPGDDLPDGSTWSGFIAQAIERATGRAMRKRDTHVTYARRMLGITPLDSYKLLILPDFLFYGVNRDHVIAALEQFAENKSVDFKPMQVLRALRA
jgi:hypothetical protein